MTVLSVVRASVGAQIFAIIREFTPERNLSYVIHVAKASVIMQNLLIHRGFTQERNLLRVRSVAKASIKAPIFKSIRVHTEEKLHKCGKCAKGFSWNIDLQVHQSPHKRNCLNVGLLRHKLSCSSGSPHRRENFKCEECGKDFNHSSNLHVVQRVKLERNSTSMTLYDKGLFRVYIFKVIK